ncbi:hypothetical protein ABH922_001695 [Rhodococcus sp. 27YEA15]|uniref:TPR repeat region-containing protein n=1 Tax=Rhodococcus sp. 27YEA15 TaxID=3156259 RepID=UPI003C7D5B92
MTLSISQIRSWNLDAVDSYAASLGNGRDVFDSNVDTTYRIMDTATTTWSGTAATAAWDSATRLHTFGRDAVSTVADAQRCVTAQTTNLRYARETLVSRVDQASADGFTVADDGSVTATPDIQAGADPHDVRDRLEYHAWRIGAALTDVNDTDARAAGALADITAAGTSLLDRKADFGIPDATLTATTHSIRLDGHGADDSDVLARSTEATPESEAAKQRLIAATTLTSEQQAQLAAGGPVVLDPIQLAYLREFYADTDLDEMKDINARAAGFRTLAFPDANIAADPRIPDALASGMFTVANPHVGDGTGTVGSLDNLPPDVRTIFSDPAYSSQLRPDEFFTTTKINHYDDSNALTDILRNADPATQSGSALSSALLDRTADLAPLHTQTSPSAPMHLILDDNDRPISNDELDSTLTTALDVATRDTSSNAEFLTDPAHKENLTHLFTRDWNDDGRAVSGLTQWIGPDATHPDPAVAERAGTSALALAHNLADGKSTFLDIPGLGDRSIGEVNPALTQSIGAAMTPYIGNLVGLAPDQTGTLGFENLDTYDNRFANAKSLIAIIDSDPEAAAGFNAHMLGASSQLQGTFVEKSMSGDIAAGSSQYAIYAGRVQSLMDGALEEEALNRTGDAAAAQQDILGRRGKTYDELGWLISGGTAMIPGFGPPTSVAVSMLGVELRDHVVGAPVDVPPAQLNFSDRSTDSTTLLDYRLVQALDNAYGRSDFEVLNDFRIDGDFDQSLTPINIETLGNNATLDGALQDYLRFRGFNRDTFMVNLMDGLNDVG